MAWEIEGHPNGTVDKAHGMHHFFFIDRNSSSLEGAPARYQLSIQLGTGADGESCPHCGQAITRAWKLDAEGVLRDADGKEVIPREEANKILTQLSGHHERMDKHAQRHGAQVVKVSAK
ncbi:MAG TPA: hypothetical protein VMQ76_03800 [Terracidiphilus sp.]|jgi:hypothetical protein|nr:hypothetical protein [Terracidiphilus sp.]